MKLRQSRKWDYDGNMDLSIKKIEEKEQNCQMVYETILCGGGEVTTGIIKNVLIAGIRYTMNSYLIMQKDFITINKAFRMETIL